MTRFLKHRTPRRCFPVVQAAIVLTCVAAAGLYAQESSQSGAPPQPQVLQLPAIETAIDSGEPGSLQPWVGGRYRLTPGDVIELRFPLVPEFDQTVSVQPDGFISLRSLGGDLRVQGRTLPELKAQLAEAYAGILRDPAITIILREFEHPYFIASGEVAHPGKYELRGATTVTQALVLAGGHTRSSKTSQVLLFRRFSTDMLEVKEIDVKKMYETRNLSEDPLLRPGDTIFVPRSTMSKITPFIPKPSWGFFFNPF